MSMRRAELTVLLVASSLSSAACGQEPPGAPPASAFVAVAPSGFKAPTNLKEAMAQGYWNPSARGPLLLVGADVVRPYVPKPKYRDRYAEDAPEPSAPPLAPPPPDGYRPEAIAPYFGYKTVRLPTLTVLAPAQMTVLTTCFKGEPNPFVDMHTGERMALLFQTLTQAQWKAFCSPSGLGQSDLEGAQRSLFLSAMPKQIRINELVVSDDGQRRTPDKTKMRVLSPGERAKIRLRVNRTLSITVPSAVGGERGYGTGVSAFAPGSRYQSIQTTEETPEDEVFGAKYKQEVPSKLKAGHLDFAAPAFARTFNLEKIKTVAQLVATIRTQSGVELYADGRLAALSFQAIGGETGANMGEVLKALCWATSGTWRKVGNAFVLTHDIDGISQKFATLGDWQRWGSALQNEVEWRAIDKMREANPGQYFAFAPNDPFALSAAQMEKVLEKRKVSENYWLGAEFRLNELPAVLRTRVIDTIALYNKSERAASHPLIPNRAQISSNCRMVYLLPSGEEIYAGGNSALYLISRPEPDTTHFQAQAPVLPSFLSQRCALLWNTDERDTQKTGAAWDTLAQIAKAKGFKELWVRLPLAAEQDAQALAPALAAGKKHGLSVLACVRLMCAPPVKEAALPLRDLTITGETSGSVAARLLQIPESWPGDNERYRDIGDYLRPDASALPHLKRRLVAIGRTSGVAGVVLSTPAPEGYEQNGAEEYSYEPPTATGYTVENRLAFLRAHGYDPIDFGQGGNDAGETFSLFSGFPTRLVEQPNGEYAPDPKAEGVAEAWNKRRYKQATQLMPLLYTQLRTDLPQTPIYMMGNEGNYTHAFVGSWDAPDKLPFVTPRYNYDDEGPSWEEILMKAVRKNSQTVYHQMNFASVMTQYPRWYAQDERNQSEPGSLARFRSDINQRLEELQKRKAKTWNGLVLNMSHIPAPNVALFLSDVQMAPREQTDKTVSPVPAKR